MNGARCIFCVNLLDKPAFACREEFIRDSLAKAKKDREQSEAKLMQIEDRLGKAREEATAIVDEGRRDAEVLHRKLQQEARDEADATIERARREISLAKDTAVKELYERTARLATDAAARIVRKELNADDHRRLVDEAIEELARAGGNGHG